MHEGYRPRPCRVYALLTWFVPMSNDPSSPKGYWLLDAAGQRYRSDAPGSFGGHAGDRIYGRLDCPTALRAIERGGYAQHRVFFANEQTATAAGYRPCAICMPDGYRAWRGGLA